MATVKRKTASELIIERILAQIESGELRSGQQLTNERALAAELGVSRVPLREAICALSSMGILEARQGGGTFVSRYNPILVGRVIHTYSLLDRSLRDEMFEARMLLESDAARLAAKNRTQQDLTLLRFALNRYEIAVRQYRGERDEYERILAYDNGVHLSVATASHNNFFVQMVETIRHASHAPLPDTLPPDKQAFSEVIDCHEKIFFAIEAQNCPAAHEAMQSHLLEMSYRQAVK